MYMICMYDKIIFKTKELFPPSEHVNEAFYMFLPKQKQTKKQITHLSPTDHSPYGINVFLPPNEEAVLQKKKWLNVSTLENQ